MGCGVSKQQNVAAPVESRKTGSAGASGKPQAGAVAAPAPATAIKKTAPVANGASKKVQPIAAEPEDIRSVLQQQGGSAGASRKAARAAAAASGVAPAPARTQRKKIDVDIDMTPGIAISSSGSGSSAEIGTLRSSPSGDMTRVKSGTALPRNQTNLRQASSSLAPPAPPPAIMISLHDSDGNLISDLRPYVGSTDVLNAAAAGTGSTQPGAA